MASPHGRRATLKDVAGLAGTSVATASRALDGSALVAAATRERVLKAARSLHYQPNLQARALRRQASHVIGLSLPTLLNAGYIAQADAISQILTERGYHLLLAPTHHDPLAEAEAIRGMIGQNVDGLILVPSATDQALVDYLRERDVPAVAIVRRVPGDQLDTVAFEDFKGAHAATGHLLTLGHRRIGYIGGDINYSSNQARWLGHLAALRDAGVQHDPALIKLGTLRDTWGELAGQELFRQPAPPTAIFAASNALMPGVIRILQSLQISIPADVSLVCFDDVDWFAFTVPPITAISASHARLAETAVTLLLSRIERPDQRLRPPALIEIGFELVLRNSTAGPRDALGLARPASNDGPVRAMPGALSSKPGRSSRP